jgi:Flp pilus assembly protein TadD
MSENLKLIRLAERQINLGNPRGAIEPLRKVLADDPNHALAHAYLGMCLQQIGQPVAARSSIETALALAPEYGFVLYAAGFVALSQKRLDEAETRLTRAREINPGHGETYRLLAIVYSRTKRVQNAWEALQEALRHEPFSTRILADIGTHLVNSGKLRDAEDRAIAALRINPESLEAHVLQGQIRLFQHKPAEARECALTALSRNAAYEPALWVLAASKLQSNVLAGIWWRIVVWIGRNRQSGIAMAVSTAFSALAYVTVIALFGNGLIWQGWVACLGVALIVAALWLPRAFLKRAVRNELKAFRLRRGF